MENAFIREVYDSLQGDMADGFAIRDIENLFKPGAKCEQLYAKVYHAQRRLEKRLGVPMYDEDVEMIIHCMTEIQWELCCHMYYYGAKLGNPEISDT